MMRRLPSIAYGIAITYSAIVLSIAVAQGATIGDIVNGRTQYQGKHVDLFGTVHAIRVAYDGGKRYEIVDLCSDACIEVVTPGRPPLAGGEKITVHGTFLEAKRFANVTLHDAVSVDRDTLL